MSLKRFLVPTLNQKPLVQILDPIPALAGIPKIIHQTWASATELDPALKRNILDLKAMNPTWEHRLYGYAEIEDFISRHYPASVLRLYRKIDPRYGAARADLFRYLLLYKVGGVYLDIKSTTTRPLDDVLRPDDAFLLAQWSENSDPAYRGWGRQHHDLADIADGEYQQWHIVAAPGHPFLKSVLERVLRNIMIYNPGLHGTGKYGVLRVTGPIPFTLAIHDIRAQHRHRLVDAERDLGLRYSIFAGESHTRLFSGHYSEQTAPVIQVGPARMMTARILGQLQSAWGQMKQKSAA